MTQLSSETTYVNSLTDEAVEEQLWQEQRAQRQRASALFSGYSLLDDLDDRSDD